MQSQIAGDVHREGRPSDEVAHLAGAGEEQRIQVGLERLLGVGDIMDAQKRHAPIWRSPEENEEGRMDREDLLWAIGMEGPMCSARTYEMKVRIEDAMAEGGRIG